MITTRESNGPLSGENPPTVGVPGTVNAVLLVAVPPGPVTLIVPVVAPFGTVALIFVSESTVKLADVRLNFTEVAPVKFVPLIVTEIPGAPLVGENDVMVGAGGDVLTVKSVALVAVPDGVVTEIAPDCAPLGTVAVIFVSEFTVKAVADLFLNLTSVAPVKLVPLIVTTVPTGPKVGENDVIVGAPVILKFVELVALPLGVVTLMGPVVAPDGTVAVIFSDEFTVKLAPTPLNVTDVAPSKFVPLIVTAAPGNPEVGENVVIVGAAVAVTTKLVALRAVPSGVVTEILPVWAMAGTVAVILTSESTVKDAVQFLNFNCVAPVKFVPLIVTAVPTGPLCGENDVIVGAAANATSTRSPADSRTASTGIEASRRTKDLRAAAMPHPPSERAPERSASRP